ncbi:hypothetical protein [Tepidibacillus fermentans]|uniref:Uncharacterized protein n=1 Tax=Tepidibacillus fermentans TaxID=1281767 RepID=A0A4V2USS5_9BACI|nr:hypothetical protein [Tepidibacillus fermentans]TCS82572.1 hypothetical protein EDD72_10862 [Tepidibacillus fermentans]
MEKGQMPMSQAFSFFHDPKSSKFENKVLTERGKTWRKKEEKCVKNGRCVQMFISNGKKWGRKNAGWSGGGRNEFIRNLQQGNSTRRPPYLYRVVISFKKVYYNSNLFFSLLISTSCFPAFSLK